MYCGDGINDLIALAAADVGVAIGASDASAAAGISTKECSIAGATRFYCSFIVQHQERLVKCSWQEGSMHSSLRHMHENRLKSQGSHHMHCAASSIGVSCTSVQQLSPSCNPPPVPCVPLCWCDIVLVQPLQCMCAIGQ